MPESQQIDKMEGKKVDELLWEIALKTRSFLDMLEGLKLSMGEAEKDYQELRKSFAPLMHEAKFLKHVGRLHIERHQWKEALDIFKKIQDETPDVLGAKGEIYLGLKDYARAEDFFKRFQEADENNPVAWFKRAHINFLTGTELEDSVFYLERALELNPDYVDGLVLMCKAWLGRSEKKKDEFVKKRMLKEALNCLDRAEKQSQDDASPIKEYNLARVEALRAKADPAGEEKHLQEVARFLEDAVEKDSSGRMMIREMVNNEKAFADLGIEFVEVQEEGRIPAQEEEPAAEEDTSPGDEGGEEEERSDKMLTPDDLSEDPNREKPHPRQKKAAAPAKIGMVAPDDLYQ